MTSFNNKAARELNNQNFAAGIIQTLRSTSVPLSPMPSGKISTRMSNRVVAVEIRSIDPKLRVNEPDVIRSRDLLTVYSSPTTSTNTKSVVGEILAVLGKFNTEEGQEVYWDHHLFRPFIQSEQYYTSRSVSETTVRDGKVYLHCQIHLPISPSEWTLFPFGTEDLVTQPTPKMDQIPIKLYSTNCTPLPTVFPPSDEGMEWDLEELEGLWDWDTASIRLTTKPSRESSYYILVIDQLQIS
jgi:hypothetical protein